MRNLSLYLILLLSATGLFAQSPHGNSIGKRDCSTCHISSTWKVDKEKMQFQHDETNFKLTGQHATVDCASCHKTLIFSGDKTDCFSCHKDVHQNTVGFNCERCHSTTTWIVKNIKQVHQLGRFPLVGVHQSIECQRCHQYYNNLNFQPINSTCFSCHSKDYYSANAPNHVAAGYSTDCETCHSVSGAVWAAQNFQHDFFPLTGGHKIDNCFACHKQNTFAGLASVCVSCHQANFNSAPNHIAQSYPTDCTICHSTSNWTQSTFNHATTPFPLTGAHSAVACNSCHTNGYGAISTTCVSCHQANFNSALNHVAQSYPTDCTICHSTTNWTQSTFNHATTPFPLTGAHSAVACNSCHTNGFGAIPTICVSCHQANFNSAPNHIAQSYPTDCTICHSTTNWTQSTFNHATTPFPLTGVHTTVTCNSCHTNGYGTIPTTCVSCHQANYNSSTNPNHVSLALPTDCSTCHTTIAGWANALFPNHNIYFQLTGAHITTATCATCHNGNFTNTTPTFCVGCHQSSFNGAVNPNHTTAGIPTACETCHNSTAWIPSTFVHANTGFALTGLHATIQCSSCHVGKVTGLSALCLPCHQSVFNTALNHVSQSYPTTCELCHNTTDWTQSTFNHQTTQFPLTGVHITVTCNSCHTNGFGAIPITCVSCHQANYNSTNNPSHTSLSLATTCETCHSTNAGWAPATFSTHSNYYVLAGAHTSLACALCHTNNTYNGSTPNTCIGCHLTDYNGTTNPNHAASQFSTDCASCHTQTVWTGATFNHDAQYFPIYSGRHNGRWTLCSQCHQDQTNYLTFTCMSSGCHAQSTTTSHHSGVSGYVYQASACYNCHPKGTAGKIIFQHNKILQ